jgi:hypothetical protein
MGTVDDLRKVLQDFLAPELRGITARLDALAQIMDARFDAVESRMDARFDSMSVSTIARFDSLSNEIAQIKELIDVDRRLARLESKQTLVAQ